MVDYHKLFSWLGNVVGMPFLAAGLLKRNGHKDFVLPYTVVPIVFLFLYKMLPNNLRGVGNSSLSTIAILSCAISSILVNNLYGLYCAIAIIVAAIVIGTEGSVASIPRVDLFHYVLALANIFYSYALS